MFKYISASVGFLNRNTGFLILLSVLIFGFISLGFQKDNRTILEDTKRISADTKLITQDTERIANKIDDAVSDLKNDNAQQTVILCKLILSGNVTVTGEDAEEVERICQDRITQNQEEQTIQGSTAQQQQTPTSDSKPKTNSPKPDPEDPEPPVDEGLIPDNIPIIGGWL